jgi:hypothetical protein
MELRKANDTYDVYNAKISFLELQAIADALRDGGKGAVADELRRSFEWHLNRVPGPGEEKGDKEEPKAEVPGTKPEITPDTDTEAEAERLLPSPDEEEFGHDEEGPAGPAAP